MPDYFPNVFKTLAAVVITSETIIWTPTSGKRFRVLGFLLAQGVATGAVTLRDGVAGRTLFVIPAHTLNVIIPINNLGGGLLSGDINRSLTAQGVSTETLSGTIWGIEE